MEQPNTISINGVNYVRADQGQPAETFEGLEYKIIRTAQAGVFAGYLKSRVGNEATVLRARRIFYWDGAASLSGLAMSGTSKPSSCKFPEEVTKVELIGVIEVLDVTEKARKSIEAVKIWEA